MGGELVELSTNAGDADTLQLTPKKIGNVVSLSRESIEDSAVAELDAVGTAMVKGVATKLDAKYFSPDAATATAPAGIFATTLPSGGTTVDIDGLIGAVGVVGAAVGVANAIFLSPADLTKIRQGVVSGGDVTVMSAAGVEKDRRRDVVADTRAQRRRSVGGRHALHRPGRAARRRRGLLRRRPVHVGRRGGESDHARGLGQGDPDAFAVIGTPT